MLTTPLVRLVDDDEALRNALLFSLRMADLRAVGYESAEEFLRRDDPAVPGCVVMDIRMTGMSGLECHARMPSLGFDQPVVFLSGHGDIEMALLAVKNGAADFFTKPVDPEKLARAARELFAWNLDARRRSREREHAHKRVETLTPRELDVALETVKGDTNKAIAARLGVSEQAVKIHRSSVYAKLEVRSAVEIKAVLDAAGVPDARADRRLPSGIEARLLSE